jgi:hypothetical protein
MGGKQGGEAEGKRGWNSLSSPPRHSMARTKLRWRSAVHLILGSLDRMYCLTAPFLTPPPPPISSIASKMVERTRAEKGSSARGRQVLEKEPNFRFCSLLLPPGTSLTNVVSPARAAAPASSRRSLPLSRRRVASERARGVWRSSRRAEPCLFFLSRSLLRPQKTRGA